MQNGFFSESRGPVAVAFGQKGHQVSPRRLHRCEAGNSGDWQHGQAPTPQKRRQPLCGLLTCKAQVTFVKEEASVSSAVW